MPTYDYTCSKCGHQFESIQSITQPPLTVCPKELCKQSRWGKGKVSRGVGGGAGLLFKGSGFYITDYRSENYKQSAKKEKDSGTAATPKPAESKPSSAPTPAPSKPAATPAAT